MSGDTTAKGQNLAYILYALPQISMIMMFTPMNVIQGVYIKHYALSLSAVAGVLLFARLFDAFLDPLAGYVSDRICQRFGSRKPLMLVGAIVASIGAYGLYSPPPNLTISYFACWTIVFYSGWTLFEMSHEAWGGEQAADRSAKRLVYSYRSVASRIGLLIFYAIPLLPIFKSSAIAPETLRVAVIVAIALLAPTVAACLWFLPDRALASPVSTTDQGTPSPAHIGDILRAILRDGAFATFIAFTVVFAIGDGIWYGLIFIYVESYLGMGEHYSQIQIISSILALLSAPVWLGISRRVGNRNTILCIVVAQIICFLATGLIVPSNADVVNVATILIINNATLFGFAIVAPSLLSDICDRAVARTGDEVAATYFAIRNFASKTSLGFGTAAGLAVISYFGFSATVSQQAAAAEIALRSVVAILPVLFLAVSAVLASKINAGGGAR